MRLYEAFPKSQMEWEWTEIIPSGGSEPRGDRRGAVFTRNGSSGVFVLAGGRTSASADLSDLWTFNTGTLQWTEVVASGLSYATLPEPRGYTDGAGKLVISHALFSGTAYEIDISTGAENSLSFSGGSPSAFASKPLFAKDPAANTVYGWGHDSAGGYLRENGKVVHDLTANTATGTGWGVGFASGVFALSGAGYCPDDGLLYCFGGSTSYYASWKLSSSCVYTCPTTTYLGSFNNLVGVSNLVGAVTMPQGSYSANPWVWSATEGKFFIFVASTDGTGGLSRVLTYDPAAGELAEILYLFPPGAGVVSGEAAGAAGNCGQVVESNGEFYLCVTGLGTAGSPARIWKLARA